MQPFANIIYEAIHVVACVGSGPSCCRQHSRRCAPSSSCGCRTETSGAACRLNSSTYMRASLVAIPRGPTETSRASHRWSHRPVLLHTPHAPHGELHASGQIDRGPSGPSCREPCRVSLLCCIPRERLGLHTRSRPEASRPPLVLLKGCSAMRERDRGTAAHTTARATPPGPIHRLQVQPADVEGSDPCGQGSPLFLHAVCK